MLPTKETFWNQRQSRLEVKEWKTTYHTNSHHTIVGLAILISG